MTPAPGRELRRVGARHLDRVGAEIDPEIRARPDAVANRRGQLTRPAADLDDRRRAESRQPVDDPLPDRPIGRVLVARLILLAVLVDRVIPPCVLACGGHGGRATRRDHLPQLVQVGAPVWLVAVQLDRAPEVLDGCFGLAALSQKPAEARVRASSASAASSRPGGTRDRRAVPVCDRQIGERKEPALYQKATRWHD
jgi:hypothetical protein